MKLNFAWKEDTLPYQNGESLFLGRIKVASYGWNITRNRDKPNNNDNWVGSINLPNISNKHIRDNDTELLKTKIESLVNAWFDEATK